MQAIPLFARGKQGKKHIFPGKLDHQVFQIQLEEETHALA